MEGDVGAARRIRGALKDYPVLLSRDLSEVRNWLRANARGTERFGLVASSNALRLKPEGIHIKSAIEPPVWFLNDKDDVRALTSSLSFKNQTGGSIALFM